MVNIWKSNVPSHSYGMLLLKIAAPIWVHIKYPWFVVPSSRKSQHSWGSMAEYLMAVRLMPASCDSSKLYVNTELIVAMGGVQKRCNSSGLVLCLVCQLSYGAEILSYLGPCFSIQTMFPGMGISIIKMRWSHDHLIFIMGIPILVRWHHYTDPAPWWARDKKVLRPSYLF